MNKIKELIQDDKNFNKGTEFGNSLIEKSFIKFGAGRSILIDKNNRIIAGNKSVENAMSIGIEDVQIIEKLSQLELKIDEQNLLQKEVLNFNDACKYLDISASHLYKLTSQKQIPHFCPQGKKLYFNRQEIDEWLMRNKQETSEDIETAAANYLIRNKRK